MLNSFFSKTIIIYKPNSTFSYYNNVLLLLLDTEVLLMHTLINMLKFKLELQFMVICQKTSKVW